jgi:tRNA 2-thiocytidine biosynthesis protein TtcA
MRNIPSSINRSIGKAMHAYNMIADGDRIMIGVSGGVDSLVLCWILHNWRRKAPIDYEIRAVHLDMGFGGANDYKGVQEQIEKIGLPLYTEHTDFGAKAYGDNPDNACFQCARQRRNRLFALASENYTSLAFGHHKDDIIETLFINMLYGGNISTMRPKQELFKGRLAIIRPLAYLTKEQIYELADLAGITPVKNPCPMAGHCKRDEVRAILDSLYKQNPRFRNNIFAALGNVRNDYLL